MSASPPNSQPDRERDHLATLVYEAMRFAIWAAGQGIMAERGEPTLDPEDFLFDYSKAMDVDDWEGLAEVARDAITARPNCDVQTRDAVIEECARVCENGEWVGYANQHSPTKSCAMAIRDLASSLPSANRVGGISLADPEPPTTTLTSTHQPGGDR